MAAEDRAPDAEGPVSPSASGRSSLSGSRDRQRLETELEDEVGRKQARKLKARQEKHRSIWFGLGMFGMIGWAVAVPTLIGVAIGSWIDHRWSSRYSWTLMLMLAGVAVGCFNAWNWIQKEGRPGFRDDKTE